MRKYRYELVLPLLEIVESALDACKYLSDRGLYNELGCNQFDYNCLLSARPDIALLIRKFQWMMHRKWELRLRKKVAIREKQKRLRKIRRVRLLAKIDRWHVRSEYERTLKRLKDGGYVVSYPSVSYISEIDYKTVSRYLVKHPRLSERYGLVRHPQGAPPLVRREQI